MKKTNILSVIFLFSSVFVFSQDYSCDTLFFKDGKKVPIRIDSILGGRIYGKSCDKRVERFLVITGNRVGTIKRNNGEMIWDVPLESDRFLITTEPKKQQPWIFNHKDGKRQLIIPEKNRISVRYLTPRGTKLSYGKLIALDNHELALETKRKGVIKIPTETISKISLQKKRGWLGQFMGNIGLILTIILTIGVIIASLFLALFSLALFDTSGQLQEEKSGCAYIIPVLLIGSIITLIMSIPRSISDPFAGEWEVTGPKVTHYEEIPEDQP